VTKSQLGKIHATLDSLDIDRSGTIDCAEFLAYIDVPKSPFTDNIFNMIGVDPGGICSFNDVCHILMTYCVYSRDDILRFLFSRYDTDGSGAIDEHEFVKLAKDVNNAAPMFPGNFAKALTEFDVNDDGLIDFDEFRGMDKAFPLVFFPAFRLQDAMQKHFL
ncbi:unnamed protein product, partial [Discosporangium mesarthrocarpum]